MAGDPAWFWHSGGTVPEDRASAVELVLAAFVAAGAERVNTPPVVTLAQGLAALAALGVVDDEVYTGLAAIGGPVIWGCGQLHVHDPHLHVAVVPGTDGPGSHQNAAALCMPRPPAPELPDRTGRSLDSAQWASLKSWALAAAWVASREQGLWDVATCDAIATAAVGAVRARLSGATGEEIG
jgi:hypothetical protein